MIFNIQNIKQRLLPKVKICVTIKQFARRGRHPAAGSGNSGQLHRDEAAAQLVHDHRFQPAPRRRDDEGRNGHPQKFVFTR